MGYAYTLHVTSEQVAHGSAPATSAGAGPSYTGHAIVLGAKGRIDIVDGGADSLFQKGDYLLFDTTDVVVVHPSRHDYVRVPRDSGAKAMDPLQALGVKVTLSDQKVALDSLGASDTISGVPTRHYRLTIAFNMTLDAGVMQQRLATESVTDYWVASIADMRANPLLRVNALQMGTGGMFAAISARVDSAAARMGQAVALRSRATTRVMLAPGASVETRQTMDVSELRRVSVDSTLLSAPSGYKEGRVPE